MRFMKKHKLTTFIIIIYIAVIIILYFLYKIFMGSNGLPVYGDRLDGIENVPITEELKDQIVEEISKTNYVMRVTRPYINGKILKVVITVSDLAQLQPAKDLSTRILELLDADQRAFYDVEVFLNKEYNCTLEATGKMDEDGNFIGDVEVKFLTDLSKSKDNLE